MNIGYFLAEILYLSPYVRVRIPPCVCRPQRFLGLGHLCSHDHGVVLCWCAVRLRPGNHADARHTATGDGRSHCVPARTRRSTPFSWTTLPPDATITGHHK